MSPTDDLKPSRPLETEYNFVGTRELLTQACALITARGHQLPDELEAHWATRESRPPYSAEAHTQACDLLDRASQLLIAEGIALTEPLKEHWRLRQQAMDAIQVMKDWQEGRRTRESEPWQEPEKPGGTRIDPYTLAISDLEAADYLWGEFKEKIGQRVLE